MKTHYILMIASLLLISSCSGIKNLSEGAHIATFKADDRASLITIKNGKATMLSEVQPDAVITSVMKFTNSLKLKDEINAQQLAEITQAVTSLGERTEAVNILRDALYRLAEIRAQGTIDNTTETLFCKIIQSAETIALADKLKNQAKLQRAENENTVLQFMDKGVFDLEKYLELKKIGGIE